MFIVWIQVRRDEFLIGDVDCTLMTNPTAYNCPSAGHCNFWPYNAFPKEMNKIYKTKILISAAWSNRPWWAMVSHGISLSSDE